LLLATLATLSAAAMMAAALLLMPFMITALLASSSPTYSIDWRSTRSYFNFW
jgi:hypothetical protein